jgi:hypothetical protein
LSADCYVPRNSSSELVWYAEAKYQVGASAREMLLAVEYSDTRDVLLRPISDRSSVKLSRMITAKGGVMHIPGRSVH